MNKQVAFVETGDLVKSSEIFRQFKSFASLTP